MKKEISIFNTIRSKIDAIRSAKTTNKLPKESKDKFLNRLQETVNVRGRT